jgi:hypothetical protein
MTITVTFEGANAADLRAQINAFLSGLPAVITPSSSPPATVPASGYTLPPAAGRGMLDSYPTSSWVAQDADLLKLAYAVAVDGVAVHPGFGPAMQYATQPDGSVKRA